MQAKSKHSGFMPCKASRCVPRQLCMGGVVQKCLYRVLQRQTPAHTPARARARACSAGRTRRRASAQHPDAPSQKGVWASCRSCHLHDDRVPGTATTEGSRRKHQQETWLCKAPRQYGLKTLMLLLSAPQQQARGGPDQGVAMHQQITILTVAVPADLHWRHFDEGEM